LSATASSRAPVVMIGCSGQIAQAPFCNSPNGFRWSRGGTTRRHRQRRATLGSSGFRPPLQ
jgi:hypothetical protein